MRVASAAVLAPIAIGTAWLGGWIFTLFWAVAALAVWWEWAKLVDPGENGPALFLGGGVIVLAAILSGLENSDMALLVVALGALAVTVAASRHAIWLGCGIIYAAALLLGPVAVRGRMDHAVLAILFLFAIVWTTDIAGYFAGRAFGGPKLAPSISPKKTWSGAVGGTIAAAAAGIGLVAWFDARILPQAVILSVILSIVSQAGDLAESWVKRRFGTKDASNLIPGHGGVMDRLDGFLVAAVVLALFDEARDMVSMPSAQFFIW